MKQKGKEITISVANFIKIRATEATIETGWSAIAGCRGWKGGLWRDVRLRLSMGNSGSLGGVQLRERATSALWIALWTTALNQGFSKPTFFFLPSLSRNGLYLN